MPVSRGFVTLSKIILVNVFVVILAGAVVRMTQSGMGCPDWPKCFGMWIPPTDESQLPANYKEIYAFKYVDTSFNVYHTWVEYVNRLSGAFLGLLLIIHFLWSLKYRKTKPRITWLSLVLLLLTGFQGWFGSKVVEANLEVAKVTTHMLIALVIAGLAFQLIYECREIKNIVVDKGLKYLTITTIVLLAIQIILGTGVREQIDHISLAMNFESRGEWIGKLDKMFYIHRTFSLLIAACAFLLFFKFRKYIAVKTDLTFSLILVIAIIALGVVMNYLDMPALAQPLHLLLTSILVVVLYSVLLKTIGRLT